MSSVSGRRVCLREKGEELPHKRGRPIGVLVDLDQIAEIRVSLIMPQ